MASFTTLPVEIQSDIVELALPHHLCCASSHGHHIGISPAVANTERINELKKTASNIVLACPSTITVVVHGCRKRCARWRRIINSLPKPEDLCTHTNPCAEWSVGPGLACSAYERARKLDQAHLRLPEALEDLCVQMEGLAARLDDTRAQTTKLTEQRLQLNRARAAKVLKRVAKAAQGRLRLAALKKARAVKAAKQRLRRATTLKEAKWETLTKVVKEFDEVLA